MQPSKRKKKHQFKVGDRVGFKDPRFKLQGMVTKLIRKSFNLPGVRILWDNGHQAKMGGKYESELVKL